ncbi:uncharacterized protein LOC127865892 [Dreissena polymorpha]|uniref:Uncharacterized protein n=1 Tax=Dreissena polymorpha TaxID=45954 RepID=A0A9D4LNQ6_DREPO|nr:uncharacterized protein LOC127865892 [Dreissena polymorpha]KAH3861184.1 hypothetical protein DPMN_024113 [Dreissena polymorpha]
MKVLLFGSLAVLLVWSSMAMSIDESIDEEVADALDARDLTPANVKEDCELKCQNANEKEIVNCLALCVIGDAMEMAGSTPAPNGSPQKRKIKINWREVGRVVIAIIKELIN